MHLFGFIGVGIVRAMRGNDPYKRAVRLGKKMLRHPASFAVPWPALVDAEYAPPLSLTRSIEPVLVDPLLLTHEHDGGLRKHVVFIQRDEAADAPEPPAADLFERRARFEQLSATLAFLTASVEGNGRGPFTSLQLNDLSKGWFGGDGVAALGDLAVAVGVEASAADLTARAGEWLAQFPIGAALNGRQAQTNGLAAPELPARGWPFPGWVNPGEVVPWLDLL